MMSTSYRRNPTSGPSRFEEQQPAVMSAQGVKYYRWFKPLRPFRHCLRKGAPVA
jgi:hypothetical protein